MDNIIILLLPFIFCTDSVDIAVQNKFDLTPGQIEFLKDHDAYDDFLDAFYLSDSTLLQ
jgi:hypothetical protein